MSFESIRGEALQMVVNEFAERFRCVVHRLIPICGWRERCNSWMIRNFDKSHIKYNVYVQEYKCVSLTNHQYQNEVRRPIHISIWFDMVLEHKQKCHRIIRCC